MFDTLRDFVLALDSAGELKSVTAPVSPVLEIAQIADVASKSRCPNLPSDSVRRNDPRHHDRGGHALLFENAQGSDVPVLINAWGSYRRMEMALGCHDAGHTPGGFDALAAKVAALVKPEPPSSLRDAIRKLRQFLPLLKIPPKRRRGRGLCQEVVLTGDQIDLHRWPFLRCWPLDGDFASLGYPAGVNDSVPGVSRGPDWDAQYRGRYITLGGIHTIHADDRDHPRPPSHNIGMYRVQMLGRTTMAMHWHMHHDGARHWRSWKARGEPMPVAIALGGESVMPYAATAPLPPGISELLLAGFLNRRGIPMVRAHTVPLWVPANAEIVIEGFVSYEAGLIGYDPRSGEPLGPGAVFEGPFGDHTGFYSMPDRYPVLTVTAITHRKDPIYPTTIVGLPPQEDYYLGKATERLFLPLLKTIVPDIEDYDLPMFGAFHNCAFIKIRKHYPLHARRVMHAIWGAGQMSWTKSIFVVDDDVDVHDTRAVLAAAARRCDPARDVELVSGPLDILDHAAPRLGSGRKMGFDCTRKIPGEEVPLCRPVAGSPEPDAAIPDSAAAIEAIRALPGVLDACTTEDAPGWCFIRLDKRDGAAGEGHRLMAMLLERPPVGLPRYTLIVGSEVDLASTDEVLFHWLANADAGRDMARTSDHLVFDASPKVPSSPEGTGGDARNGCPVREWPPIIRMTKDVIKRVESRRAELGL